MIIFKPDNETESRPLNPRERKDWVELDKRTGLPLPLNEMAISKTKMESYLMSHAALRIRYDHLLKLFYFRDNERDFNGWSVSVWNGLNYIPLLKNSKGKDKCPDAQFIYTWAWGNVEDTFEDWHKVTLKDFNNKGDPEFKDLPYVHVGGDEETAGKFVKAYHIWLAKELSAKGSVSKNEVQDEIKELLRKYQYK